jgi:hypothetical protein
MRLPHRLKTLAVVLAAILLAPVSMLRAQDATTRTAALEQSAPASLSQAQLDQLLAPIALYSDTLIAQVLMASTYPLEVVEADRWAQANSALKGDELVQAVERQRWDASVKALVQVPTVLRMMSEKLEWTENVGDAFLSQERGVMDSVQRLRRQASNAGNLDSSEQQTVVRDQETIIIEQASPEVVYVPTYDLGEVYGPWPYPDYPPYYWAWDYWGYGYWPYASPWFWGAGFWIGGAVIWNNHCDWHNGHINNHWRQGDRRWRHDAAHRRGVDYRDRATRERFARGDRNLANRDVRARDTAGGIDRRGVARLNDRDLTNGREAFRDRGAGRDNQLGNRGRDRFDSQGARDGQFGNRTGARDRQFGNPGGDRFGQGRRDFRGGAVNRSGGDSFRAGRMGGFDSMGRGGSPRSFGSGSFGGRSAAGGRGFGGGRSSIGGGGFGGRGAMGGRGGGGRRR